MKKTSITNELEALILGFLIKYEDEYYTNFEIAKNVDSVSRYDIENILEQYENEVILLKNKKKYILVCITAFPESSMSYENYWKMVEIKSNVFFDEQELTKNAPEKTYSSWY